MGTRRLCIVSRQDPRMDFSEVAGIYSKRDPWPHKSSLVKEILDHEMIEGVQIHAHGTMLIIHVGNGIHPENPTLRHDIYDMILCRFFGDKPVEWTEADVNDLVPNLAARFRGPNDEYEDG